MREPRVVRWRLYDTGESAPHLVPVFFSYCVGPDRVETLIEPDARVDPRCARLGTRMVVHSMN